MKNNTTQSMNNEYKSLETFLLSNAELTEQKLKSLLIGLLPILQARHQASQCYPLWSLESLYIDSQGVAHIDNDVILDFSKKNYIRPKFTNYLPFEAYTDDTAWHIGPWSDIYGLCAVLYEIITKTKLDNAIKRMINDTKISLINNYSMVYNKDFLQAIENGLILDVNLRTKTIAEFADALNIDLTRKIQTQNLVTDYVKFIKPYKTLIAIGLASVISLIVICSLLFKDPNKANQELTTDFVQRVDEQKLAEQKLAEEKLAEQKLIEQEIEERRLAEQKLAEQKLAEQKIEEQRLAEQKLAESKLAEEKMTEQNLIEQKIEEQRLAEQELIEKRLAEQKIAEQKLAEQKLAEQKLLEQKIKEHKLAEQKLEEQKLAEQRLAEQKLLEQKLEEQRLVEQKLEKQALAEQNKRKKIEQKRAEQTKEVDKNLAAEETKKQNERNFTKHVDKNLAAEETKKQNERNFKKYVVKFIVRPWGEIYIDKVYKGTSPPLHGVVLSKGKHHIRINNKSSGSSYNMIIDVQKDMVIRHSFSKK